jgi:hypothetical protein
VTVLESPRWRRRLLWLGSALTIVAIAVVVGVKYPNTADEEPAAAPTGEQEAQVYHEPKTIRLSSAQRARVLATAANFVTHAVARKDVGQAYDLTHPSLRGGMSRTEWNGGTIPVVPFPVDEAQWKLEYVYEDSVGLQVLLYPTAGSGLKPEVFNMELAPVGKRFLVSSWAPTGMAGGGTPAAASTGGVGGTRDLSASIDGPARLDSRWLFAPIILFSLVPLLLIGYFARNALRSRRAAAAYAASSSKQLPPLPRPRS